MSKIRHRTLSLTVDTGVDLTSEPAMTVSFGIGNRPDPEAPEDSLKVGPTDIFLRVLELLSFEGNFFDYSFEKDVPLDDSAVDLFPGITPKKRMLASFLYEPQFKMDILHYQLHCGNEFFLDRLGLLTEMLEARIKAGEQMYDFEHNFDLTVDFISCLRVAPRNSDPACLWGSESTCFFCDSQSFWDDERGRCSRCITSDRSKMLSNDRYFGSCNLENADPVYYGSWQSLKLDSEIAAELYFIDSSAAGVFADLLVGSTFVSNFVNEKFLSNLGSVEYSSISYRIDFSNSKLTASQFPLNVSASLIVLFRNQQNRIDLASRSLFVSFNSFPIVKFTLRRQLPNPRSGRSGQNDQLRAALDRRSRGRFGSAGRLGHKQNGSQQSDHRPVFAHPVSNRLPRFPV